MKQWTRLVFHEESGTQVDELGNAHPVETVLHQSGTQRTACLQMCIEAAQQHDTSHPRALHRLGEPGSKPTFALVQVVALARYIVVKNMVANDDREWKKGSAELLVLSLLEDGSRHGYDIAKLIDTRSGGTLRFRVTSLYPLLYRLEDRDLIEGRWVEKPGQRRRRYYRLTREGRALLDRQRRSWKAFVEAVRRVTGIEYA